MGVAEIRDLCGEAGLLAADGDAPGALEKALEALAQCRRELGEGHYAFAHCLTAVGWAQCDLGEIDLAEDTFGKVASVARALAVNDPENGLVAMTKAAQFFRESGDIAHAKQLTGEMLTWASDYFGADHPRYYELESQGSRV